MLEQLKVFQTAGQMARFAATQQSVVARNIANADTPGYRAVATSPFSEIIDSAPALSLRMTRSGHIAPADAIAAHNSFRTGEASPNGNTVSIEEEMVAGANIRREHEQALAIYRHALTVLRLALGR